jgi:hypothetical protein
VFGLFKKRLIREHAKLVCQCNLALCYIGGYYGAETQNEIEGRIKIILGDWRYGGQLTSNQLKSMLDINREIRILYDNSLGSKLAKFDKEFCPVSGWSSFYQRVEI